MQGYASSTTVQQHMKKSMFSITRTGTMLIQYQSIRSSTTTPRYHSSVMKVMASDTVTESTAVVSDVVMHPSTALVSYPPLPPPVAISPIVNSDTFNNGVAYSGLRGQALQNDSLPMPSSLQLRSVIPPDCFVSHTFTSLKYLAISTLGTTLCTALGVAMVPIFSPQQWMFAPVWMAYAAVTGTVAMGLWVLAHECGHGAFSSNKKLQDTGTNLCFS
jgi:hypothetical protein